MFGRTRVMTTAAALGAALLAIGPLATTGATTTLHSSTASTAAAGHVPIVVARMGHSTVHLSVGHRLHAGRVIFRVVAKDGGHALQLARLHKGYTLKQAGKDFARAFRGDVKAIRRLDDNITFMGGASATPQRPGAFAVNLRRGRLLAFDQNGNGVTRLRVFGTPPSRPTITAGSAITAFSYGFGTSQSTLPKSGWTQVRDQSDQPHFVVFLRVKDTTTNRMVRRFVKSGGHGNPSWALKVNISTGVISPNRLQVFRYDLPAGKYLLACFWPDDDTGMPHFFMGMWKLIRLQ
jgi:hypothetical protein